MNRRSQTFSGRIIFDHLPKTAGQAVNAWLSKELGGGSVTPNLIGRHRDLIRRYGGEYAVISAHIEFEGNGLDPRYSYVTCLREPIDRALSWLFFVVKNHEVGQLPGLWEQVEHFIASEGDSQEGRVFGVAGAPLDWDLCLANIANPYVEHFARISGLMPRTDDEKIQAALSGIERYDVYGTYEDMPAFLSEFAALIEVLPPTHLERVNVTLTRPKAERISDGFRKRLENLNRLDLEFYRVLQKRLDSKRFIRMSGPVVEPPNWLPYERVGNIVFTSPEIALLFAEIEGGDTYFEGQIVRFNTMFSMSVDIAELEVGIDICDEEGRVAFSTSNASLNRRMENVSSGTYSTRYYVAANLPAGQYTAGFSFRVREMGRTIELARYEALVPFRVSVPRPVQSNGYVCIPIDFDCLRTGDAIPGLVVDSAGCLISDGVLGELSVGESLELELSLCNESEQIWTSTQINPISLSYHWFDEMDRNVVFDGGRTALPERSVAAGAALTVKMRVVAPKESGRYRLVLMPVQDGNCWFDERGFEPLELDIDVMEWDARRVYRGADIRLSSHVGRREYGAITSTGRAGFLMFGPYVALSPGRYSARLDGWVEPSGNGSIWLDVCSDRGTQVFTREDLISTVESGAVADCTFYLEQAVSDLEIRVWVAAEARIRIDTVRIEPL